MANPEKQGWIKPLFLGFCDAVKMILDFIFSDTWSTKIMDIPEQKWEDVLKEGLNETRKE